MDGSCAAVDLALTYLTQHDRNRRPVVSIFGSSLFVQTPKADWYKIEDLSIRRLTFRKTTAAAVACNERVHSG